MRNTAIFLVMLLFSVHALAAARLHPMSGIIPPPTRQKEFEKDSAAISDAFMKIDAICYDAPESLQPLLSDQAPCKNSQRVLYRYKSGNMHYQYSPKERAAAQATVDRLTHKWKLIAEQKPDRQKAVP